MTAWLRGVWPMLAGYLAVRVWQVSHSTVAIFPDTRTYRPPPGSTAQVISWTGHATRMWGTPVFFALFPDDLWRMIGQWAVSTVAWGTLAVALWQAFRTTTGRILAAGGTLMLAVAPQVAGWDFVLLSESLSISLGVLAFALFLKWRRSGSWPVLALMTVVGMWWAFSRFEMALLLAVLAVAVIWHSRRIHVVVAFAAMLGAMGWAAITNSTMERDGWGGPYSAGGGLSEELMVYRLGRIVYLDPRIERVFAERLGLPSCPGLAEQARRKWDIMAIPKEYRQCPELRAWVKANSSVVSLKFAMAAPRTFVETNLPRFGMLMAGINYSVVPTAFPLRVFERALYPRAPSLTTTLPVVTLVLLGFAFALGGLRQHRAMTVTAIVVLGAAVASQLFTLAVAVADLSRLGTQESTMFRLGLVLLLAVGGDLLVQRYQKRREISS